VRLRIVASVAGGMLLLGGSPSAAVPGSAGRPLRVLFVGNSLTETNDLPAYVAALAAASGRKLETRKVTFAGFSLEDHWNQGDARAALATKSWDVVVMQQGPSALPESQVHLSRWARRFAAEARAAGTQPGLLGVWPDSYRRTMLADVVASYGAAAEAAGAELYPAGAAWRAAWACNRRVRLYGPDGFHPSRLGTYVAALVVYGRLFRAPLLSPSLRPAGVPRRISRVLQWAAATALGRRLAAARRCGG
jgi:hypothetical protein